MYALAINSWKRPWVTLFLAALLTGAAMLPSLNLESRLVSGGFESVSSESKQVEETLKRELQVNPESILIFSKFESGSASTVSFELNRILAHYSASDVKVVYSTPTSRLLSITLPGTNFDIQAKIPEFSKDLSLVRNGNIVITGQPVLNVELNTFAVEDALRAEIFAAPILFLILLFLYRRIAPVLITFAIAGVTLTISKALGFLIASTWPTSVLYANITSMIGLAVSIDYVLFIYSRYRDELSNHGNRENAIKLAFSVTGRTVLYAAVAVALGFTTLAFSELMPIRSIGIAGVLVILTALITTHTVLPACLKLFAASKSSEIGKTFMKTRDRQPRLQHRGGVRVATLSLTFLLAAIAPLASLNLTSPVAGAEVMPSRAESVRALSIIKDSVPKFDIYPIEVVAICHDSCSSSETERLRNKLEEVPSVAEVLVQNSKLKVCIDPSSNSAATCKKHDLVHLRVFSTFEPNDQRTKTLVEAIRGLSETQLLIGGAVATGIDFDNAIKKSIPVIIIAVLLLGLVVFAFAFKSLWLGFMTLVINLLVVGASLGITNVALWSSNGGALNSVTPLVLFAVIFGLTMDYLVYSVHLVQDHWSELGHNSYFAEVPLSKATKTITGAALLMLTVFLAFLTAELAIVRELGIGMSVGVVLDALIARKALLPYVLDRYRAKR